MHCYSKPLRLLNHGSRKVGPVARIQGNVLGLGSLIGGGEGLYLAR